MTEIIAITFLAFVVGISSYGSGYDAGKEDQCKTMNAEYYKGECVIVQRKKVEL